MGESERPELPPLSPLQTRLAGRLVFNLTPDQIKALGEINRDLAGPGQMARLLQGDVGSGKTLVAFVACLGVIAEGGQCRSACASRF